MKREEMIELLKNSGLNEDELQRIMFLENEDGQEEPFMLIEEVEHENKIYDYFIKLISNTHNSDMEIVIFEVSNEDENFMEQVLDENLLNILMEKVKSQIQANLEDEVK